MPTFDHTKDLKPYIIKSKGNKDYLLVQGRMIWLNEEASDFDISTALVEGGLDKDYATYKCRAEVWWPNGRHRVATAHKTEHKKDFPDFEEKSETGSIGRALALLGFGTQFAGLDFDEGDRIVDSPVALPAEAKKPSRGPGWTDGLGQAVKEEVAARASFKESVEAAVAQAEEKGDIDHMRDDLERDIKAAKTSAALKKIGAEIAKLKDQGLLDDADRDYLAAEYDVKARSLAKAG